MWMEAPGKYVQLHPPDGFIRFLRAPEGVPMRTIVVVLSAPDKSGIVNVPTHIRVNTGNSSVHTFCN